MRLLAVLSLLTLCGCVTQQQSPATVPGVDDLAAIDVLLLGEQHDAAAHQRIQRELIVALATRGQLAAVVIEMAEQGTTTARLPRDATEQAVQTALRWENSSWPWPAYGPVLMAAVRSGITVSGANLPRSQLRAVMADASLDTVLPGPALKAQQQAIRLGHCELLPESQIGPMTRVQIARDRAMAQTAVQAAVAGKTLLLIAGSGHVDSALGIPRHLPASLRVKAFELPPEPPQKDYCAELRSRRQ